MLLGLLRRNLSISSDRKVRGLVRPLLEYASQAWDPYKDNLSNEIEKIQRRAARFVISDYQNYELGSVTKLLKDLGWKSLKNRREVDRLCLLKKGLDNNAILPLDELSKPARKTRHMHNRYYTTIYARTNIFKFSFVPRTIRDGRWTMLSSANYCYLRFCRNLLTRDVNNIIHSMNEVTSNKEVK